MLAIDTSIADVFFTRAEKFSDRIALSSDQGDITYAQLALQAANISAKLRARQIGHGDVVGLYLERSANAIAAILGILHTGAAYIAFDSAYPVKIRRAICKDCSPSLVICDEQFLGDPANDVFWSCESLAIENLLRRSSDANEMQRAVTISADDPACLMYTSGSTGMPKGVVIPHRAVLRLVIDNNYAQLNVDETLLQLAPLSFDASLFEIWGALLNGGTLAVPPAGQFSLDDIGAAIQRFKVTTLWLTAGIFHLMVEHRVDSLKPLRQLLAGGDVLSPTHVAKALKCLPHCTLINGYGPTENTTFSCCYTIPRDLNVSCAIPIGKAIAHTDIHLLDDALQPVAVGEIGELFVGGAGLALGYWNRPELTAARFITNHDVRWYRTGDRVRMRADGNLEFLGRTDRQIKINGKRVELDAVEACLRHSGLVADAAVVSFEPATLQRRIAAFVTPIAGQPLAMESLHAFIRNELPDYMWPATILPLDELPLSPSGKVERSRLPIPESGAARPTNGLIKENNSVEETLRKLWKQILGVNDVGTDDNFFDAGGTSLQLVEFHAAIVAVLKQEIKLTTLFKYPTIAQLASAITSVASIPLSPHNINTNIQTRMQHQRNALGRARARALSTR